MISIFFYDSVRAHAHSCEIAFAIRQRPKQQMLRRAVDDSEPTRLIPTVRGTHRSLYGNDPRDIEKKILHFISHDREIATVSRNQSSSESILSIIFVGRHEITRQRWSLTCPCRWHSRLPATAGPFGDRAGVTKLGRIDPVRKRNEGSTTGTVGSLWLGAVGNEFFSH